MAGIVDPMMDMLLALEKQGWTIVNMAPYEPNMQEIAHWCRQTFGDMLINPDVDIGRWFGTMISYNEKMNVLFAFRDSADYTMLQLRWA